MSLHHTIKKTFHLVYSNYIHKDRAKRKMIC